MRLAVPLFLISGLALAAQSPAAVPLASTAPARVPGEQALAHRIGHDRPAYPHFARAAGIEGVVKANLIIGSDGNIKRQMEITGPPSLIASAQAWINASHFRPFVRGGQPVAIATTLPVVFRLPSGTHPARPLLAIYQRNIPATIGREGRDNPPQVRWPALSPAMRDWVARYEAAITADRMADSSLTLDAPHQASLQVLLGVWDGHDAGLRWMAEVMVRALDPFEEPTVRGESGYDFPGAHPSSIQVMTCMPSPEGPGRRDGEAFATLAASG